MNKNSFFVFNLLTSFISIVSASDQLNNDDQLNQVTNGLPANLFNLTTINMKNNNSLETKALPIINTNELWRLLSKLRIGSFFTSKTRALNCECPTQPAIIPIPIVERIHHHYDKHNSPLNKHGRQQSAAYELKTPFELKQAYALNNLNDKTSLSEQSIRNEILDKTRFADHNDLIKDNGRSITSVRTSSNTQQQQTNPSTSLHQDAYLFSTNNAVRLPASSNSINNKNYRLPDTTTLANKDELLWPVDANSLDKQTNFMDMKGRFDVNRKEDFNPAKVLRIAQQLLNEVENNQRDLYKLKILRLINELEKSIPMERWPTKARQAVVSGNNQVDARGAFSSNKWLTRPADDLFTSKFADDSMSKLINDTMNFETNGEKSTFEKDQKSNQSINDEAGVEDDEYFTDYLPSETVLNYTLNQTAEDSFSPTSDLKKLWRSLSDKKMSHALLNEMKDKITDEANSKKSKDKFKEIDLEDELLTHLIKNIR